jgi:prophage antirepressor-like protein
MATQDNSIQTFKFAEGVTVRSILDENNLPWFVAADVCTALGLTNATKALLRLDEDEQTLITIQGKKNGNDQANIINESGLYSLILTSRKAEAKRFKKWVTAEVLPAIRKNGKYEVKQPETVAAPKRLQCPRGSASRKATDLSYVTKDPHTGGVRCWDFKRAGGENNWANADSTAQGESFWAETVELARHNPKEAEYAITYSLLNIIGGDVEGRGMKYQELVYCRNIAKAALVGLPHMPTTITQHLLTNGKK